MAKNNGRQEFDIPTVSLAKAEVASGSRSWMKAMVKEHGDTDPLKLERRRARVSALTSLVDEGFERLQLEKKACMGDHEKKLKELRTSHTAIRADLASSKEKAELEAAIQHVEQSKRANKTQYNLLLNQQAVNLCMLESLCLIVDSVTVREILVNRTTGKKGVGRVSAGACMDEAADSTSRMYRRMKKLYEVMSVAYGSNPDIVTLLAEHADDENDDEKDDETDVSDDDIVTAEDAEEIKRKVSV